MDAKRKRLRFRCWHRGMKEMDLILGPFADRYLPTLGETEIAQFTALLDEPDPALYAWVSGAETVPAEHSGGVFDLIILFSKSK